jgi:tetratricopeptide (TPR) repeat protein
MVAVLVAVAVIAVLLLSRAILPRMAHRAFVRGGYPEARRWYRVLAWTSPWPQRRAAARVSIAGAYLAEGRWAEGAAATDAIDGERLDAAVQAGWLNNRAYAALRRGATAEAAARALADIRAALRLRPEVPALLHTEGLALLATGRAEDAIRAFELMWEHGELEPRLEAERAADLGRAWAARGETAYAADYARRARRAVPDAPWVGADDGFLDPALD